jgi:hypothetical protein
LGSTKKFDVVGAEKSAGLFLKELHNLRVGNAEADQIRYGFRNGVWNVVGRRREERVIVAEAIRDIDVIASLPLVEAHLDFTSGFGSFGAVFVIGSMAKQTDSVFSDGIAQGQFETVRFRLGFGIIDSFLCVVKGEPAEGSEIHARKRRGCWVFVFIAG